MTKVRLLAVRNPLRHPVPFPMAKPSREVRSPASAEDVPTQRRRRFQMQFHKTTLCQFWLVGHCGKGEACSFAHGTKELSSPPNLRKTALCCDFKRRQCGLSSDECKFAHGRHELRATDCFRCTTWCNELFGPKGFFSMGDACRHAHSGEELSVGVVGDLPSAPLGPAVGAQGVSKPRKTRGPQQTVGSFSKLLGPGDVFDSVSRHRDTQKPPQAETGASWHRAQCFLVQDGQTWSRVWDLPAKGPVWAAGPHEGAGTASGAGVARPASASWYLQTRAPPGWEEEGSWLERDGLPFATPASTDVSYRWGDNEGPVAPHVPVPSSIYEWTVDSQRSQPGYRPTLSL